MKTDELVDQIVTKYGMPENLEVYRAILAYVFATGVVEGAGYVHKIVAEKLTPEQPR